MERARDALRALTVEQHGVDGSKIYLYGEGWDYAEVRSVARGHSRPCQTLTRSIRIIHTACTQVENNQRGVNASQWNLAHTGVGSFNDRIREACNGEWRPPPQRACSPQLTHTDSSQWQWVGVKPPPCGTAQLVRAGRVWRFQAEARSLTRGCKGT